MQGNENNSLSHLKAAQLGQHCMGLASMELVSGCPRDCIGNGCRVTFCRVARLNYLAAVQEEIARV